MISITEVLKKIVEENRLDYGLDKVRVREVWGKVVGVGINKYTENVHLNANTLFVKLSSASLANELIYRKTELITLINNEFNKEIISELIIS